MKKVGVLISDAKLLFEVLESLRNEDLPFEILESKKRVAKEIRVVISTEEDKDQTAFRRIISCSMDNIHSCINEAKAAITSSGRIRSLIIGIDPGIAPGIAVMADQSLVDSAHVNSPEAAADAVREFVRIYKSDEVLVRIGHGDRTKRNRIFNAIWDLGISIEIVDERNTTPLSDQKDIDAAIEIALTSGYRPGRKQLIEPPEGEISDIQRLSRISSDGELTISRSLAKSVAKGECSMEEAIELQRKGKKGRNNA